MIHLRNFALTDSQIVEMRVLLSVQHLLDARADLVEDSLRLSLDKEMLELLVQIHHRHSVH